MGISSLSRLVKTLSISNSRYVPSRYIPNHAPMLNILSPKKDDDKRNNFKLLRRRFHGETDNTENMYYFTRLSTDEDGQYTISPKHNLYPPFPKIPPYPVDVIGSCNGLLCLKDNGNQGKVVLWDPKTNEFKFLPKSCIQCPPSAAYSTFCCSGFGFDGKTEDYKVVRFVNTVFLFDDGVYDRTESHVELYSLKSDSWREISDPDMSASSRPSAYVNGVYYWMAFSHTNPDVVLSFDFSNEEFTPLDLPVAGDIFKQYTLALLEFDGMLSVIIYPWFGNEKSFHQWILKDNKSWTKVSYFHVPGAERPLGFKGKNELFLEGINHELLLFNLSTRELKNLGLREDPKTMQLIPYVESMCPLIGKSKGIP